MKEEKKMTYGILTANTWKGITRRAMHHYGELKLESKAIDITRTIKDEDDLKFVSGYDDTAGYFIGDTTGKWRSFDEIYEEVGRIMEEQFPEYDFVFEDEFGITPMSEPSFCVWARDKKLMHILRRIYKSTEDLRLDSPSNKRLRRLWTHYMTQATQ